jgi:ABC-type transport system involved in multi-copper enzyme maturation permease subunit
MSSLARIWTIAMNTLREAVRNKLLYALLFFGVALILMGVVLAALSYVESERILQDFGFAAIRLFSVAIAIFVGVTLIHREIERRTVYAILSKPLSRAEFLLGKYLGLVVTIWLQLAIMVAFFLAVSVATGAPLGSAHAVAVMLIAVELAVIVAVATFFSAFTTPMLASFFSVGIWALGHMTRDLRDIGAGSVSESVKALTAFIFQVMPDLESFNFAAEAAHGLAFTASEAWLPVIYGLGYVSVLLIAAIGVFERRDLR